MFAPVVAIEALLGLGGATIYASNKLWTALCAGDAPPSASSRARAWGQFSTSLLAGPLFAATMTDWAVAILGHNAPWPAIAVTIGLFGNALWPLVLSGLSDQLKARLKAAFSVLSKGDTT